MNKYVLHNTGNCIHYLAKTNNGEESKKEYVFTYNTSIKINFVVYPKQCKSIVLQ